MFSTDYPFERFPDGAARRFLHAAELGEADRNLIASGNWDRMRAGIDRQRPT